MLELAARSTASYGLRAYGAVQLASAMTARTADPTCDRLSAFDNDLRAAAAAEGFACCQPDARCTHGSLKQPLGCAERVVLHRSRERPLDGGGPLRTSTLMRPKTLIGVVLAVVVVSGCASGEPDQAPTTIGGAAPVAESPEPAASVDLSQPSSEGLSSPSSLDPSPEPSLMPPPLPELATQQTSEGAEAFAMWWFDTLNYATATGDTAGLAAASGPDCEACANYIEEIDTAYRFGGRIEGGLYSVKVNPPDPVQELGLNLAVFYDVEETTFYYANLSESRPGFAAGSSIVTFGALKDSRGWLAGAVTIAE